MMLSSRIRFKQVLIYFTALCAPILALLLQLALVKKYGEWPRPSVLFTLIVLLVATWGGVWPGLLATTASALLLVYWVIPPHGMQIGRPLDALGLALFCTVGVGISVIAGLYHRYHQRSLEYQKQLAIREALRKSEERFHALVAATSDVVYSMSPDGSEMRHLQGKTFLADTKSPTSEWLQKYVHPDEQSHMLSVLNEAVRTKSIFELEHRVLRADGSWGWAFSRAVPLLDANGDVVEWFGAASDVTRRKHAEEVWRNLSAIVESSYDAIIGKTLDGAITSWNPGAERLYGYSAAEMLGQSILKLLPPDSPNDIADMLARVANREHIKDHETIRRRKDGSLVQVSLRVSPILDSSGNVTGASTIAHDITEQRHAQEKIRLSEQRYRSLVRAASQLVWTCDAHGLQLHELEDWQLFTGQTAEQATGWGWLNAVHPEDRDKTTRAWRHAVETKSIYSVEYRVKRKDGAYRVMHARGVPVLDSTGQVKEWIGMNADVTEQRLTEERIRRNEKLAVAGRLALNISHEINNPLAAVTNLIYLIRGDPGLNGTTRTFVAVAERELARASQAATRNLRFANTSSRQGDADLRELTDAVIEFFLTRFETDHISIERDYRAEARLRCYPYEVQDVIANLLSNAHDAMRRGGKLKIRIREARCWNNSHVHGLKLTIADTGTGIRRDLHRKVFEPFFTTKHETGAGLGLWVCSEIMRKHEGQITFRTSTDPTHSGTVFSLFFPLQPSASVDVELTRAAA